MFIARLPAVRGSDSTETLLKKSARLRHAVLAAVVFASVFASAAHALQTSGSEFQVNTYTSGSQVSAQVAGLTTGGFIVVWSDLSRVAVAAQHFDAVGNRIGSEALIASGDTDLNFAVQSVAPTGDGGFLAVWVHDEPDGGEYGLAARRYAANGSPTGQEFAVNSYTTSFQRGARAVATPDGFVVVWGSSYQDGSYGGVFGQRFTPSGTPTGPEFQSNTYTLGDQSPGGVAADDTGRFVVVWTSGPVEEDEGQDGSFYGIFGQRYASDGSPDGPEFAINTYTSGFQVNPDVAMASDGRFLVVWEGPDLAVDPGGKEIWGRMFDADGQPLATEFPLHPYSVAWERHASVAVTPDGEFLVTWRSGTRCIDGDIFCVFEHGDASEVMARKISADGGPEGSVFLVSAVPNGRHRTPSVSGLVDGGFAIAWETFNHLFGIGAGDGDQVGLFGLTFNEAICGDTYADGIATSRDALLTLTAAVGLGACAPCACDVNGSDSVTAVDALIVLRVAVGEELVLDCGAC